MSYFFEDAGTLGEERAIALSLPREDLAEAVHGYSWDGWNASTMGAIADREDCPLIAALFIFDLGDADYHAGQMASGEEGADPEMFALFQRIEARINAGGYGHRAEDHLTHDVPVVQSYLAGSGHEVWALDPDIVGAALARPPAPLAPSTPAAPRKSAWPLSTVLWVAVPWCLFLLLFWSDVQRILFG